jgi:hypothetical protein
MNRITCGPPIGPINKGRTTAVNHCELKIDGVGNGLLLKAVYAAAEDTPGCEVYEWRGLRPVGPRGLTFVAGLSADLVLEHIREALA